MFFAKLLKPFIRFSTLFILTAIAGNVIAQNITVQPIEKQAGEQKQMVVSLMGGATMTALQFNLKLPDGVTLAQSGDCYGATLGAATDGHTLCTEPLAFGDYLFVLYSFDLKPFRDGELLRIPVTFANDAKSTTGQLNTIRMSDTDAVSYTVADTDITTGIGDGVKEKRGEEKSGAGAVYDISGQKHSSLQRGMNIVRGADGNVRKIVKR